MSSVARITTICLTLGTLLVFVAIACSDEAEPETIIKR